MRAHSKPSRSRLALNRDSSAKLGAALLLAIALATSLPALMRSEQPEPLGPDVGIPQAAAPPAAPVAPPSPDPKVLERKAKAVRLEAKRAAAPRPAGREKASRRRSRRPATPGPSVPPPAPVAPVPTPAPAAPVPTHEDFGFEGR